MPKHPPDLLFIPAAGATKKKEAQDEQRPGTSSAPPLLKDRMRHVQQVTARSDDLDAILQDVKAMEEVCAALRCKTKVRDFAIACPYCKNRFCTAHYLPEVHGCGDAVRKDYKHKYMHPGPEKLPPHKKDQCATKLQQKLKQMQDGRKKSNTANSGKGKAKK